MSTLTEKLEAIQHAVEVAKRRKQVLDILVKSPQPNKAHIYELDMVNECIRRGESLLKEHKHEK